MDLGLFTLLKLMPLVIAAEAPWQIEAGGLRAGLLPEVLRIHCESTDQAKTLTCQLIITRLQRPQPEEWQKLKEYEEKLRTSDDTYIDKTRKSYCHLGERLQKADRRDEMVAKQMKLLHSICQSKDRATLIPAIMEERQQHHRTCNVSTRAMTLQLTRSGNGTWLYQQEEPGQCTALHRWTLHYQDGQMTVNETREAKNIKDTRCASLIRTSKDYNTATLPEFSISNCTALSF